jgi:hypothetical protein
MGRHSMLPFGLTASNVKGLTIFFASAFFTAALKLFSGLQISIATIVRSDEM